MERAPDAITVLLSWSEVFFGVNAGILRHVSVLRRGRVDDSANADNPSWDRHINGALAELAVAKWRGEFWSGTVGRIDLPDVGPLQVRSKTRETDRLVLKPADNDDEVFVCVLVQPPVCKLTGWLYGREAKRPDFAGPKGLFYAPDASLRPMATLTR